MAEATRKKRIHSKRPVSEKCGGPEVKEDQEGDGSMQELLAEYGDLPLPSNLPTHHPENDTMHTQIEARTEDITHLNEEASENKEDEHKNDGAVNTTEEGTQRKGEKGSKDKKHLKSEADAESESEVDCRAESKHLLLKETESTIIKPAAPDFSELNQELMHMEPYFQAQKQLKGLTISEATSSQCEAIVESSPVECSLSKSPNISQGECIGGMAVATGDMKMVSGAIRGRCEEENEVLASAPMLEGESTFEGYVEGTVNIHKHHEQTITMTTKVTLSEESVIQPLTDIQLNTHYQNTELEENDTFVSQFVEEERNVSQLEFYEILLGYLRARTSLIGSQKELSVIEEDYKKQKKNVWLFEKRTVTEEGECEDGRMLTAKQEYVVACYKEEIATHLTKLLKQTREILSDSYSLHSYEAEMCKLQVENYMQKILSDCPDFVNILKNAPVSVGDGRTQHSPQVRPHVEKLRTCISVLFAFQRRGVKDQQFIRDTRQWLTDLVGVLLRVAITHDHLFILNHVLRCPPGLGTWAPTYIQVGREWHCGGVTSGGLLGCWGLDHSMTVLATILAPITARQHFLHHLRHTPEEGEASAVFTEGSPGRGSESTEATQQQQQHQDNVWVLVDSSGEEEEDPTQVWAAFTENDVIQLLNQVPFKKLFGHMLLVSESGGGQNYDPLLTSHAGFMKLFAFTGRLIQLFHTGLATYAQLRYRGAVKRICRLLRHTVEYVTDHWQGFLAAHHLAPQHHQDITHATHQWATLQVEYDRLFENAVSTILSSPRSGAWQFLAVIPYTSVSLTCLWKIVHILHVGVRAEDVSVPGGSVVEWAELVSHRDTRGQFHDRLAAMDENESYYLLSALANMAAARDATETEFIQVVVSNMFEATFVNEGTRESLSRSGRDLLASVAAKHSITMSLLLSATQERLSSVGGMSLYLFRALPLETWEPSEGDVTCLAHWLLFMPPSSVESQLARLVFSRLHWGLDSTATSLVLPQQLHRKVALTVVEAHSKVCGDMYARSILTEGVKQVTSVMYAPPPEKVFDDWAWTLMGRLRLHRLDQPEPQVRAALACPASLLHQLPDPTSPTITQGSQMHVLKRGIMEKKPLALYAALLLTTWGHSIPEICEHGVDSLHELATQGQYEAFISALAHITPLFFSQAEDIITNAKFIVSIQKCLSADQSYLSLAKSLVSTVGPGKVVTLLAAVILNHIKNYSRYGLSNGSGGVRFWIQLLVGVPEWTDDVRVLYLLDTLCQHAFTQPPLWHHVLHTFTTVVKSWECDELNNSSSSGGGGVLGILSWLRTSPSAPYYSLLVRPSAPQFPWFTLAALTLDTQRETESGVWPALLTHMYSDPNLTLEQALKSVEEEVGVSGISAGQLSVYRWGQQVVDLPSDHPALPVTLQMYFMLHLARVPPRPNHYECGSVINRFYQGFVNSGFLNKITKKVTAAVEHLENRLSEISQEEGDEASTLTKEVGEVVSLVRGMAGWLEETRLYEPGVYLPALPPHLLPHRLTHIFQGNWEPWPEAVDHHATEESEHKLFRAWNQQRKCCDSSTGSPSTSPARTPRPPVTQELKNPRESIVKRLDTYEGPQPPPPVPPRTPLHTPHLKEKTLRDQEALISLTRRYTSVIAEHSKTVNLWSSEMCALDCVYRELLPTLWVNTNTKSVLTAQCRPPKVGRTQPECSGHASIVMEYSEARVRERENARAEQNREQREAVLQRCQKPPPLQLCQAALSLEAIITSLITNYRRTTSAMSTKEPGPLLQNGRLLFYHIVQLTSDYTSSYPPAKQLITSCAQVLGQEFVSGHGDCQELVVGQVVEWGGQLGGLLAPHFTPSTTPTHTFLTLYASLAPHAHAAPDHIFMLLSKFDIERWLSGSRPSSSDRIQLLNSVGAALTALLPRPTPPLLPALELYRVHLRLLLGYRFPEHYTDVLTTLLHLSPTIQDDSGGVGEGLWFDLVNTLAAGVAVFAPNMGKESMINAVRNFAQHQSLFSHSLAEDTLRQVSSYFVSQRLECGLYGLYPRYRPLVEALALFLCLISHAYVATTFHASQGAMHTQRVHEVWWSVEGLWAGWVAPLGGRERESWPGWLRGLTRDVPLLLPWTPSDASTADTMMALFTASLHYMHDLVPGGCDVLGLTLEYYSSTFATREVKSHVLAVVHAHLTPLPWNHFHPSLHHTQLLSKVVEQYLPECHSFIGSVLVQVSWSRVIDAALSKCTATPTPPHLPLQSALQQCGPVESSSEGNEVVSRLHTCLLNLLVRLSMEPSVRQSPLLLRLLEEGSGWSWWTVGSDSYQRVVNWWVMSCDPRIILHMPDRNPVDLAVIQLLHRGSGYAPDTSRFHPETSAKRGLLVRALVRLLTSAAARHKALLQARPHVFTNTITAALTHMETTLIQSVDVAEQWREGCVLSGEVVGVVSGGAASPQLQALGSEAVVTWVSTDQHPSPALLLPLLASASRSILHLNHRNPILQATITILFSQTEWSGWEGAVTWESVVGVMSFPVTNPAAMLNLAAQEGHLLVVYAHTRWRRRQPLSPPDLLQLLTSLCDILPNIKLSGDVECGLVLLVSEVVSVVISVVVEGGMTDGVWPLCWSFTSRLATWAEDHATTGILAAIGLGRQSPLSLGLRLYCHTLATFIRLQMPRDGTFRTHPTHTHSDTDSTQVEVGETCSLDHLRGLTTSTTYATLSSTITQAVQFLEDPAHCLQDCNTLVTRLVTDLFPGPLTQHLTTLHHHYHHHPSPSAPPIFSTPSTPSSPYPSTAASPLSPSTPGNVLSTSFVPSTPTSPTAPFAPSAPPS